jgi:hypothetical protein
LLRSWFASDPLALLDLLSNSTTASAAFVAFNRLISSSSSCEKESRKKVREERRSKRLSLTSTDYAPELAEDLVEGEKRQRFPRFDTSSTSRRRFVAFFNASAFAFFLVDSYRRLATLVEAAK